MSAFAGEKKVFLDRFKELQKESVDEQRDFFTRRFVFSLGDAYSDVFQIATDFKLACEGDEGGDNLSMAGAAGFMQHQGKTRTATQRRQELADVDLNQDGKVSFIEYLLLHFKVMILTEYFNRHSMEPDVDLSADGVGVVGVGDKLVEELFSVPQGIDTELEKMMEEFSLEHNKRKAKIEQLEAKVATGGVKGMAAKNELMQLKEQDTTDMNAVEARIAAAVKKAVAKSKKELASKEAAKADAEADKLAQGRNNLADKAKTFGKRVSQRLGMGK